MEKINANAEFAWPETYAHPQEDIYQLYVSIKSILNTYRAVHSNSVPLVLQGIEKYIDKQMRLPRDERDDISQFKAIFINNLNSEHPDKAVCEQLLQNANRYLTPEHQIAEIHDYKNLTNVSYPPQKNVAEPKNKDKNPEDNSKTPLITEELSQSSFFKTPVDAEYKENTKKSGELEIKAFQLLSEIINDEYWEGKATLRSIAGGIKEMRRFLAEPKAQEENQNVENSYQELRNIAQIHLDKRYFFVSRDPEVQHFYSKINKHSNIEDLARAVNLSRILAEQKKMARKYQKQHSEIKSIKDTMHFF